MVLKVLKPNQWIDCYSLFSGCKYRDVQEAVSKLFLPQQLHGPVSVIWCSIRGWSTLKAALLATDLIDLESFQRLSGQDYILMFHVCIKDLERKA